MIDIHSHLLYDIDDGSKSLESSIKMLEAAAKDGVKSIILTPHFFPGVNKKIEKRLEILRPEAKKFNIELFSGCEYDFHQLTKQDKLITLGKSRFVLVDFCLSPITPININSLYNWQIQGYKIILAHPERSFSQDDLSGIKDLAEAKVYFQLNAGSFLGDYGHSIQKFAKILVKKGFCHFIASDAHSPKNYAGQIPTCQKYFKEEFFTENPQKMLNDKL